MMSSMRCGGLAVVFFFGVLSACASDAAPEPEAEIETPGAFVAVDEGMGTLRLSRTLSTLRLLPSDDGLIVFYSVYDVDPSSWEQAREISKSHDIPVRILDATAPKSHFTSNPYRVVWFRTLTDEERERVQ